MAVSTITSKNQTTLPAEIREVLGVKSGDKLDYTVVDGIVIVRKFTCSDPYDVYLDEMLAAWDNPEDDGYNTLLPVQRGPDGLPLHG